jgi:hypothetical protein
MIKLVKSSAKKFPADHLNTIRESAKLNPRASNSKPFVYPIKTDEVPTPKASSKIVIKGKPNGAAPPLKKPRVSHDSAVIQSLAKELRKKGKITKLKLNKHNSLN